MSVTTRCITVGMLVFLYWTAAFSAALLSHWTSASREAWWTPSWLRTPGHEVGDLLLDLLRSTFGHNNLYAPGSSLCWALITAAAAWLGTGAWFLCALLSTCLSRISKRK